MMWAYTTDWGRQIVDKKTGNTLVTDWGQRSQAYALNTATKAVLTGANTTAQLTQTAVLGAAGEGYQYFVGHAADPKPGVDREKSPVYEYTKNEGGSDFQRVPRVILDGVLREGKNIGLNEPCSSIVAICQGTPISNGLNLFPGFNSFGTLHDTWMNWFEFQKSENIFTNISTMPAALILNYGSLVDQYKYIINGVKNKK
jgi:filamentous hemagglutinin